MSSMVPDDAPRPRLCDIKKWEGFNGYGFNLHAEKGKAGQFIGKVDPLSPADLAGLKQGDRIVEINGTNISNENHQQVVQRIKAITDSTQMLVVDNEADEYYKDLKIVVRNDMPNVVHGKTPDRNPADNKDDDGVAMVNNVNRHSTNSSRSSHSAHSDSPAVHPYKIRLCHLKIWSDFQGYGFNLHAEKNKPGQYIGKVDDGSPAEAAGLREKDRILEVNGLSVVEDNHQAAVIKIKSVHNETKLLVVDPQADEYFREKGLTLGGGVNFIHTIEAPASKPAVIHREDIHVVTTSADDVHHYKARLIQLETWSDYNGYGFNMHSIKGKTGEYIGKVEHGSPSHVSGMKEGDHIIEVSGSSIADDTHNDVVGKIKAAGGRALMLVVDAETDKYYQERSIELNGNMPNIARHDCPMTKPEANGIAEPSTFENGVEPELPNDYTNSNEYFDEEVAEHPVAAAVVIDTKDEEPQVEAVSRESTPEPVMFTADPVVERDDLDDYERIQDSPSPAFDAENNNEEKEDESPIIEHEVRIPTPEPVVEIKTFNEPEPVKVNRETEVIAVAATVRPTTPESPKEAVTIAGIQFAASAEEARKRVSGRRKDVRVSANLSAKEKYDLFQRL